MSDEEMAWLKPCFIGKFSDPEGIQSVQQKYKLEELLEVSLTPMGGNLVLMRAEEGEDLETRVKQNDRGFSKWVTEIRPWNPTLVQTERTVWVTVKAVPIHIWYEETFKRISLLVGKFISIDI